jgi:threonine synthase
MKPKNKQIVIVCTGHGLKDPTVISSKEIEMATLEANYDAVEKFITSI